MSIDLKNKSFNTRLIILSIIGFLLILSSKYQVHCAESSSTDSGNFMPDVSIEEFEFIFSKIIIPDLRSWNKKVEFSFKGIQIKNNPLSPSSQGNTTISITKNDQHFIIKYVIYKNLWLINNKEFEIYSVIGPRWQTPVTHDWCYAIDRTAGTLYILREPKNNPSKNINHLVFDDLISCLFPSHISKEDFHNLCIFYLTYLYARGMIADLKILRTVKDLPFYHPQGRDKEPLRKSVIQKLEKLLYPPALESYQYSYHLSLLTYSDYNREIVEWDFNIGPDKNFNVRKIILFEGIPQILLQQ